MEVYLLVFILTLFLLDAFIIIYLPFFIFNSIILLKIRSVYKQDTVSFLEKIKKPHNTNFLSSTVFYYVTNTVILFLGVLFVRAVLFYFAQVHINLAYSAYMIAYLFIPLSFYLASRIKVEQLVAVENTIHVANRDYPVGDLIMGMSMFFYFKEEPKVYDFLKKIIMISEKSGFMLSHLVFPLCSLPLAAFFFMKTHSWGISIAIIIAGLVGFSFFYLFKRNLKVTSFTMLVLLFILILLLAGGIGYVIYDPSAGFVILGIILIVLINYLRRKRKKIN